MDPQARPPVIRAAPRLFGRLRLLAIYEGLFVHGTLTSRVEDVGPGVFDVGAPTTLGRALSRGRIRDLGEVAVIRERCPDPELRKPWRRTRMVIVERDGHRTVITLPVSQLPGLRAEIRRQIGDVFEIRRTVFGATLAFLLSILVTGIFFAVVDLEPLRPGVIIFGSLFGAISLVASVVVITRWFSRPLRAAEWEERRAAAEQRRPSRMLAAVGVLVGVLLVLPGAYLLAVAISLGVDGDGTKSIIVGSCALLWIWLFVRVVRRNRERLRRSTESGSKKRARRVPFHSRTLSWLLKIIAVAYLTLAFGPLSEAVWSYLNEANKLSLATLTSALLWSPAVVSIVLAYRLAQRPLGETGRPDDRDRALYLRPFSDEETVSLQPVHRSPFLSGYRPRRWNSIKSILLSSMGSQFFIIRLFRALFGRGAVTSEESIVRALERSWPVIAVGRPGDPLPTTGARRLYLGDEEWQEVVAREIERAAIVVMHPGDSPGLRWEQELVRRRVDPRRLLLCLAFPRFDVERFDRIREAVAAGFGVSLPNHIGLLRDPAFVWFDEQWRPSVQPLSYRNPLVAALTGDAIDVPGSIAPFIRRIREGGPARVRSARWSRRWALPTMGLKTLGYLMSIIVTLICVEVIATPGNILFGSGQSTFLTDALNFNLPERVAASGRRRIEGEAVSYSLEIPRQMKRLATTGAEEHAYTTADGKFLVVVGANPEGESLADLGRRRASHLDSLEGLSVRFDRERVVTRDGRQWLESHLNVTKPGFRGKEISRALSGDGGLLIVVCQFSTDREDRPYAALAREVLDSVRILE